MKTKFLSILFTLTLLVGATSLLAQGTAFTYQGRLNDGANPASGNYDLRFTIYDLNTGGALVGGSITNSPTAVSNGLFTVTLDFGGGIFSGADRWLQIAVRTNGVGSFIILNPRQAFTATPYAMQATSASNFTGTIADLQLSANIARLNSNQTFTGAVTLNNPADVFTGTHNGNGSGLTSLTGSNVAGAVSEALHATTAMTATNAPDGNTIVSKNGATNIVTTINSNNWLNVRDFGAKGDNAADDWQPVQNALNSHPGRIIFFPPGKYLISKPLTINSNGVSLVGAGTASSAYGDGGASVLSFTSTANGIVFAVPDLHNVSIKDLSIFGPGKAVNQGAAFCITNGFGSTIGCRFENLNIEGWDTAFNINGMAICGWQNVNVQVCNFGIMAIDTYTPFSLSWVGGSITDCRNVISKGIWTFISADMGNQVVGNFFQITNGARVTMIGCNIEQNVSSNLTAMILLDHANLILHGGKIGGGSAPCVLLTNGGSSLSINSSFLVTASIAPIWSYGDDADISSDGIYRPNITNIPFASFYAATLPGVGHTFGSTFRVQSSYHPNLKFSEFLDENFDARGTAFFFVGRTNGVWTPMDLLEYFKDKRSGIVPYLNTANTWSSTQKIYDDGGQAGWVLGRVNSAAYTWVSPAADVYSQDDFGWYVKAYSGNGRGQTPTPNASIPFYYVDLATGNTTIGWRSTNAPAGTSTLNVTGTMTVSNDVTVVGNVTASGTNTAGYYIGNGSSLTNLPAANLTGTVSDARLSSNIARTSQLTNATVGGIASGMVSNMTFSVAGTNAITATAQANNVAMGVITNGVFRLFNVIDYGAIPDGTTDCTAAIQAAVDAAIASGSTGFALSKTIYFPLKNHNVGLGSDSSVTANTYKILGTINVLAAGLTFRGEVQSVQYGLTTLFHTNNSPCFLISGSAPNGNITTFEKLLIQGNGEANPANAGIVFTLGAQPLIKDCGLFWIGTGLVFSNSIYPMVENCSLNSCGLGIKLAETTQAKVSNTDFSESNQGIRTDGGTLSVDNCMFGGPTHDNGPGTNAIWITYGGSLANVSVSNTKFNMPGATGGVVIGQFVTEAGGTFSFNNCVFGNDYGGSNLCYVAVSWPDASYASFRNCRYGPLPWFGIQDTLLHIVNVDNPYQGGSGGTNTVLLTAGRQYSSTQLAPAFRMTQPMNIGGNVTIGAFPIISVSTNIPVTGDTLSPATGFVKLRPTSAATLSLTTAISDGSVPGQLLILEGQPSGGGFTFITNNANTHLSANGHTLNVNDTLVLIWDGNNWVELSFANN